MSTGRERAANLIAATIAWIAGLLGFAILVSAYIKGAENWWSVIPRVTALWMAPVIFIIVRGGSRRTVVGAGVVALLLAFLTLVAMFLE